MREEQAAARLVAGNTGAEQDDRGAGNAGQVLEAPKAVGETLRGWPVHEQERDLEGNGRPIGLAQFGEVRFPSVYGVTPVCAEAAFRLALLIAMPR